MAKARKGDPKPPPALDVLLSRELLRELGGVKTFGRGEGYFGEGRVELLSFDARHLKARVRGTQPYRVEIWAERRAPGYSCTCPVGAEGGFCKHVVAAGLAWLDEDPSTRSGHGDPEDGLRGFLVRQEKEHLVDLLVDHALLDDRLHRKLTLEQAKRGPTLPRFDPDDIYSCHEVIEEAWAAARQHGCSEDLWLRLAQLRERSHPEDSLAVYQRQAESALQGAGQHGYETAVARLEQIRDVMTRLGKTRQLAEYLASLRLVHKRKRNFLKLLDAAKLG